MADPTHRLVLALSWRIEPLDDPGTGTGGSHTDNVLIPPYTEQADIDAFVRHAIHRHSWDAIDAEFGDNPQRRAFLAFAARVARLRTIVEDLPSNSPRRADLLQLLDVSNQEAIDLWGELPEG